MKLIDLSISPDPFATMGIATDSAIVPGGKPLFLGNEGVDCRIRFAAGYRIGRLGKSIPARYIPRHIDAMTIVAHAYPATMSPDDPRATAADFSYATGRWIEPNLIRDYLLQSQPLDRSSEPQTLTQVPLIFYRDDSVTLTQDTCDIISRLSETFTLKSGDIVLLPLDRNFNPELSSEHDILPDTLVTGTLNNEEIMSLRIK